MTLLVIGCGSNGELPERRAANLNNPQSSAKRTSLHNMRPFIAWLAIFYTGWLILVTVGNHWATVITHWPIALTMTFGSYVAGATPMGGGTVAFPVLTLLFDLPGSLGRNFGLAVQSVGMTSASIYIFSMRRELDWRILKPALFGALIGTPIGAAFIAPVVPDIWIKLIFAVVWCSFGILHLVKLKELIQHQGENTRWRSFCGIAGLAVGMLGGIVSSIAGVGIDMILYATLVLLYQADLKIAIPTSVIIMAFTSLVGISSNLILQSIAPASYVVEPAVFENWLAAAPVVALGAPFGALVVELISRTPTLILVSLLCIGQFFWTLIHEQVTGLPLVLALASVLLVNAIFHVLYRWGRGESVAENPIAHHPPTP